MNTISFLVLARFQMVYSCFDLYSPVIDHLMTICLPSFVHYSLLSIPFNSFFATSTYHQCSFHFLLSFILSQKGFRFESESNIQYRHPNTPNSMLGFESMMVSTQIFIAIHSRLFHMMIQILYLVNNRNQRYCFDGR